MSAKENKQKVEELYKTMARLFRGEDVDLPIFISEGIEWWLPKSLEELGTRHHMKGHDAVLRMPAGATKIYVPESINFQHNSWVAEDDLVAGFFTLRAKTINGRDYENDYHYLCRCRGGRIVEIRETFDTAYALFGLQQKSPW